MSKKDPIIIAKNIEIKKKINKDLSSIIAYEQTMTEYYEKSEMFDNFKIISQIESFTELFDSFRFVSFSNHILHLLSNKINNVYGYHKGSYSLQGLKEAFLKLLEMRDEKIKELLDYENTHEVNVLSENQIDQYDPFSHSLRKIIINPIIRENDIISDFCPNQRSLKSILDNYKFGKSIQETVFGLYQAQKVSHKELASKYMTCLLSSNNISDFFGFVPYHIVSQSFLFRDLMMHCDRLISKIENQSSEYEKSVNNLIKIIVDMFSIFYNGNERLYHENQIESLIEKRFLASVSLRKLEYIKTILRRSNCKDFKQIQITKFIDYDTKFVQTLETKVNSAQFSDIIPLFEDALPYYDGSMNVFENESTLLASMNSEAEIEIKKWSFVQPKKPNPVHQRNLGNLKTQNESLYKQVNNINEASVGNFSLNIKERMMKLEDMVNNQSIGFNFDNLRGASNENSMKKQLLMAKIEAKKQQILEQKQRIIEKRNKIALYKSQYQQREEEKKKYMVMDSKKEDFSIPIIDSFETLKDTCMCSICAMKKRNRVITQCGHTLCEECMKNQLKSRNRKCPACNTRFRESQIVEITW